METRKLAVIMFTDMVGYSKKIGENETEALQLLDEHNDILRPQIEAHNGHVIKTIGDAFMADFDSAANAVNCAAAIQRALAERNAKTEGEPIEVNIASRIVSRDVCPLTFGKLEVPFKMLAHIRLNAVGSDYARQTIGELRRAN